jgi:hypothetical protein
VFKNAIGLSVVDFNLRRVFRVRAYCATSAKSPLLASLGGTPAIETLPKIKIFTGDSFSFKCSVQGMRQTHRRGENYQFHREQELIKTPDDVSFSE